MLNLELKENLIEAKDFMLEFIVMNGDYLILEVILIALLMVISLLMENGLFVIILL